MKEHINNILGNTIDLINEAYCYNQEMCSANPIL